MDLHGNFPFFTPSLNKVVTCLNLTTLQPCCNASSLLFASSCRYPLRASTLCVVVLLNPEEKIYLKELKGSIEIKLTLIDSGCWWVHDCQLDTILLLYTCENSRILELSLLRYLSSIEEPVSLSCPLKTDYAHWCRTSTLIMVPINFWRNSDLFKKKNIFLAQKLTELEHF